MKEKKESLFKTVGLMLIIFVIIYVLYMLDYDMKSFVYEKF